MKNCNSKDHSSHLILGTHTGSGVRGKSLPFCLYQGTMLWHNGMHARIAAHNGSARSSLWSWSSCCERGTTRACVMQMPGSPRQGTSARRCRGMIRARAPCLRDNKGAAGRPAGEAQAGPWLRPGVASRADAVWTTRDRRGPRRPRLYFDGECRLPGAQETTIASKSQYVDVPSQVT